MQVRIFMLCLMTVAAAGCATRPPEAPLRAGKGDDVLVVDYQVAAERKVEFEQFLIDVLMPAIKEYYPPDNQPVRLWTATEPTDEGAFQYRFVADPANEYYPFEIEAILEGVYPDAGEEYVEQLQDLIEGEAVVEFQQSRW